MNDNREQERQRLTELYRGMSDEELELVAHGSYDLTNDAHEILRSELSRRQLPIDLDGPTAALCPRGKTSWW